MEVVKNNKDTIIMQSNNVFVKIYKDGLTEFDCYAHAKSHPEQSLENIYQEMIGKLSALTALKGALQQYESSPDEFMEKYNIQ